MEAVTAIADTGVTEVPITAIVLGERANRNLADLDPLMASITAEGLTFPLVRTAAGRLVLGARRLEACRLLGWRLVPAVTVTGIWEALDRLAAEQADPDFVPLPLTVPEAMGVDFAWRELQWWPETTPRAPRGSGTGAKQRGPDRRTRMASLLGVNANQYRMARELVTAARGYHEKFGRRVPVPQGKRERATEAFATVRDRRDIHPAYRRYIKGSVARQAPIRTQARSVSSALSALSGITGALGNVTEVDPRTPRSVTAAWEKDAEAAKRALYTFLKTVREHNRNGSDDD